MFKTYALAESIGSYGGKLHVLLIDSNDSSKTPDNVTVYKINEINSSIGKQIVSKYRNNLDKLRWALKPIFLTLLVSQHDKVIYLDNDIFVFSNPAFLFDELDTNNLLLTPHNYSSNPMSNQNWFEANFRVGLYNAGFIAASKRSIAALHWWANCCLYNIKKSFWRGLFDDQKYLDLLPVLFDEVKIVKHPGCNLAGWNDHEQPSEVVFIHFANYTLQKFLEPNNIYYSFATQYIQVLKHYNPSYQYQKIYRRYEIGAFIYFLFWRLVRLTER
jgi:lipopolysaccharide biosynthesis glycosyltransferase